MKVPIPIKTLIIIPARAGSKGVAGKNKMILDGKPLVAYSIEVALSLGSGSSVWLSSNDKDVIEFAQQYAQLNIHERKEAHATDASPITETVAEVLKIAEQEAKTSFDAILLLQPTSPLRTIENLTQVLELLRSDSSVNSVISVCEMTDVHPARMYWSKEGELDSILPEFEQTRRQEIPPAYYRNGAIYAVRRSAFDQTFEIMSKPIAPYIMPSTWLLNIDDPRDVLIANALMPVFKRGEL